MSFIGKFTKLNKSFWFGDLSLKDKYIFTYLWNKKSFFLLNRLWVDKNNFILYRFNFSAYIFYLFASQAKSIIKNRFIHIKLKDLILITKLLYRADRRSRNYVYFNYLNSDTYILGHFDWLFFFKKNYINYYSYLFYSFDYTKTHDRFKFTKAAYFLLPLIYPTKGFKVKYISANLFKSIFKVRKGVRSKFSVSVSKHIWSYSDIAFIEAALRKKTEEYHAKLEKIIDRYTIIYKKFNLKGKFALQASSLSKYLFFQTNTGFYVELSSTLKSRLANTYLINYSDTSVIKYYDINFLEKIEVLYIRKTKAFNKGRFSRNRQLYRTGFYWCLWINIIIVYALYFYFYRFSFTFGYFWLFLGVFAFSFFFGRGLQNVGFSKKYILAEVIKNKNWFTSFMIIIMAWFTWFNFYVRKKLKIFFYNKFKKTKTFYDEFWAWVYNCLKWFSLEWVHEKLKRFLFFWKPYPGKDLSWGKWRSKLHWIKQLGEMLITYY